MTTKNLLPSQPATMTEQAIYDIKRNLVMSILDLLGWTYNVVEGVHFVQDNNGITQEADYSRYRLIDTLYKKLHKEII